MFKILSKLNFEHKKVLLKKARLCNCRGGRITSLSVGDPEMGVMLEKSKNASAFTALFYVLAYACFQRQRQYIKKAQELKFLGFVCRGGRITSLSVGDPEMGVMLEKPKNASAFTALFYVLAYACF